LESSSFVLNQFIRFIFASSFLWDRSFIHPSNNKSKK
jgi:hypothetical protein